MKAQARSAALLAAGLVVIVLGKGMYENWIATGERRADRFGHFETITVMQAEALAAPLWDFNQEQVKSLLASLGRESSFQSATVTGPDGQVIAQVGAAADHDTSSQARWSRDVPIVWRDGASLHAMGVLRVVFSTKSLSAATRRQFFQILLGTAAVAIFSALGVIGSFRLATEKQNLAREAQLAREAASATQAQIEAERASAAAQLAFVVDTLAASLACLASGDLTCQVAGPFPPEYERLRVDFNRAVAHLRDAIGHIAEHTETIRTSTTDLANSAHKLSGRTEQQAASLEQSAAALDEMTATLGKSADHAAAARGVVSQTRAEAEQSGALMRQAIEAMAAIERSSSQIGQIIRVIDQIALQSSLLALYASVEAARAGDAGRGFAVVASEVRSLAARSAEAAKTVKTLVAAAATQVAVGVKLVGETGQALARIESQVAQVTASVSDIAASAAEQAIGLAEINLAVNHMDQITQQNAIMVEQAKAACLLLARDTEDLTQLTAGFGTKRTRPAPLSPPRPAAA